MSEFSVKQYEQDRSIVEQLQPFTEKELQLVKEDLYEYFQEQKNTRHLMLLSNDINYYTIFKITTRGNPCFDENCAAMQFFKFITEDAFLKSLGELKVLKRVGEGDVIEIWIGTTYFLLFDADDFFVEI